METVPKGVIFHKESMIRDCRSGDNWCITWAADGNQYISQDDGYGWHDSKNFNNRIWRIVGGPDRSGANPFRAEYLENYPDYLYKGGWFGYGIVSVHGIIYHFMSRTPKNEWSGPFEGAKLLYSPDHGTSWFRHDGESAHVNKDSKEPKTMFFWHEDDDWAFSQMAFVQCGRDNSLAKDDFVYIYSPNGKRPHILNLARVPRDQMLNRSSYQYFVSHNEDGSAIWTEKEEIHKRGVVHTFPDNWGWYSWLPCVVYNPGLDLYIMTTGGTERQGDSWMHDNTGSLGFYWSENPWGPWVQFYYVDDWYADSEKNRCYQPKLSPKWISQDGKEMYFIFSDAQENEYGKSHTVNYKWNQEKITLITD